MINSTLDLIQFFQSNFSMLFALVLYTVLAVVLSKSIKRHYKTYYWLFGLLSAGFVIPYLCRICGIPLSFSLGKIPLLGPCFSELSSAGNFIHPILIIIMYMGALSAKNKYVGRLMTIRKELSIIVGFPVIAHALKRIFGTFVQGCQYFLDHETYMSNPRVSSALGSGITSFVFVLGIVMFVLFLILWITSFDSVHRKLGSKRWKSIQKWSYALYAMLFIHALGINLGGYISDNAREKQQSQKAQTEIVNNHQNTEQQGHNITHNQTNTQAQNNSQVHGHSQSSQQGEQSVQKQGHGHGPQSFKFTEIEIAKGTKRILNMAILIIIYGSYLFFRIRKSKQHKAKRTTKIG